MVESLQMFLFLFKSKYRRKFSWFSPFLCSVLIVLLFCNDALAKCSNHNCINGDCKNETCVCKEGWQGPECQYCGGKINLTDTSGVITDGPGNYSVSTQCTWLVAPPRLGPSPPVVRIRLESFATECGWDHLYVYDGDSVRAVRLLAIYSLDDCPLGGAVCNCIKAWLVTPPRLGPSPPVVRIRLESFATECGWDHLYVYDGDSVRAVRLLAIFSGVMEPGESGWTRQVIARSGSALLHFFSDDAFAMEGFNVTYAAYSCPSDDHRTNCSNHGECDEGTCRCNPGWIGVACDQPICPDNCNEAYGGGTCTPKGCVCTPQRSGADCSRDISTAGWRWLWKEPGEGVDEEAAPAVAGHVLVQRGGEILRVGGESFGQADFLYRGGMCWCLGVGGESFGQADFLYRYKVAENKWETIVTLGETPAPRFAHSAVLYDDELIVYGGVVASDDTERGGELAGREGRAGEVTNEVWRLNLAAPMLQWLNATPTICGNRPAPMKHCVTNEVWRLNLAAPMLQWLNATPTICGNRPAPMKHCGGLAVSGHTAVVVRYNDKPVMLVFFGHSPHYGYLHLVQEYHIEEGVWVSAPTVGWAARGGFGHSAVLDPLSDRVFVHGGLVSQSEAAQYHIEEGVWVSAPTVGWAARGGFGHSAVLDPLSDRVFVHGGLVSQSEAAQYHIEEGVWVSAPTVGWAARGGFGHSAVLDPLSDRVFVHGGLVSQSEAAQYHIEEGVWVSAPTVGWAARGGFGHSAVLDPLSDRVFVHGGLVSQSEAAQYHIEEGVWVSAPTVGWAARGGFGHSAVLDPLSDRVFVHGGLVSQSEAAQLRYHIEEGVWVSAPTVGWAARGGFGHSAVLDPLSDRVFVHGGLVSQSEAAQAPSAALYEYEYKRRIWRPLPSAPTPRYLHSAIILSPGIMLVFGGNAHNDSAAAAVSNPAGSQCYSAGALLYDIRCGSWRTAPPPAGAARAAHAAAPLPGARSPTAMFYGGFDGRLRSDALLFEAGSPCSSHTNELACVTNAQHACRACAWNSHERTCVPLETAGWNQSFDGTMKACVSEPVRGGITAMFCRSANSCAACTAAKCAWCGSCQPEPQLCSRLWPKMALMVDECASTGELARDACARYHSCAACHAHQQHHHHLSVHSSSEERSCYWDYESIKCKPANSSDDIRSVASAGPCTAPCATFHTCSNCTSEECIWCASTGRCVDKNAYGASFPLGGCRLWSTSSVSGGCGLSAARSGCARHVSCAACRAEPACGWCADAARPPTGRGLCLPGGARRPHEPHVCETSRWFFTDCPRCQCNGHSTCDEIEGDRCIQPCGARAVGLHCDTCAPGHYGDPLNGGTCKPCECNAQAVACAPDTGRCFCSTKGLAGERCDKCDNSNHYHADLYNKGACYYDLAVDYQFTFNLSKKEDRHLSAINFRNAPVKADVDADFSITCSAHARMNLTVRTRSEPGERTLFAHVNCTNFRYKPFHYRFAKSDHAFGVEDNVTLTTFFVYVYDFRPPLWIQISFSQYPKLNLQQFFITFSSCFLLLLLVAAALWKIKQKYDLYRRRQRLFVEMEQMASRPFSQVCVELEKGGAGCGVPAPVALEPCLGSRAAVLSLLVRLPTGGTGRAPPLGGLAVASALVTLGHHQDHKATTRRAADRTLQHTTTVAAGAAADGRHGPRAAAGRAGRRLRARHARPPPGPQGAPLTVRYNILLLSLLVRLPTGGTGRAPPLGGLAVASALVTLGHHQDHKATTRRAADRTLQHTTTVAAGAAADGRHGPRAAAGRAGRRLRARHARPPPGPQGAPLTVRYNILLLSLLVRLPTGGTGRAPPLGGLAVASALVTLGHHQDHKATTRRAADRTLQHTTTVAAGAAADGRHGPRAAAGRAGRRLRARHARPPPGPQGAPLTVRYNILLLSLLVRLPTGGTGRAPPLGGLAVASALVTLGHHQDHKATTRRAADRTLQHTTTVAAGAAADGRHGPRAAAGRAGRRLRARHARPPPGPQGAPLTVRYNILLLSLLVRLPTGGTGRAPPLGGLAVASALVTLGHHQDHKATTRRAADRTLQHTTTVAAGAAADGRHGPRAAAGRAGRRLRARHARPPPGPQGAPLTVRYNILLLSLLVRLPTGGTGRAPPLGGLAVASALVTLGHHQDHKARR
ncbi:attractin [Cydia fagiglandana]|uniref:attractin n=1 Tax=Cydia fagiglandana TaxID=1458189 RepID=UPI002FEE4789